MRSFESLSNSRIVSLSQFARDTSSEVAILLLWDKHDDVDFLLVSYAVGLDEKLHVLRDVKYRIPKFSEWGRIDELQHIAEDLQFILGFSESFSYQSLVYSPPATEQQELLLGAIFYDGNSTDSKILDFASNVLARDLELSRVVRISETIRKCQQEVQNQNIIHKETIPRIASIVQNSVHCARIYFYGVESPGQWSDCDGNSLENGIDLSPIDTNANETCSIAITGLSGERLSGLMIPIHQPFIELNSSRFIPISKFNEEIEPHLHTEQCVVFLEKITNNYLQETFSATDRVICDRVFFSLQAYFSAREYQEQYNKTMRYLTEIDDIGIPSYKKLLTAIKDFTYYFEDIGIININRGDNEVFLDTDDRFSTDLFDEEYLERIKTHYIEDVYINTFPNGGPDNVFVGIDSNETTKIEVHFSSNLTETRIFVLRCSSSLISEASLRAVMHFFAELHVRYKRDALLLEREDYITQVRHIVVHHISSTLKSLASIHSTWRAATRSEYMWKEMRLDPDFPKFLDQGIGNLVRANKLLDLGRFIIDEISPNSLNRKGVDIIEIINDTFQLLIYEREAKKLIVKSQILGQPPTVMNGDEELLRIAILNLIDNAIKYSAVGREISWRINFKSDHYIFSITTNGDPISENNKQSLLKTRLRARQLDHLNQRRGTGWGLPVAYKILRAHSSISELDFETVLNEDEINNSYNTFYYTMPYLTGKNSVDHH